MIRARDLSYRNNNNNNGTTIHNYSIINSRFIPSVKWFCRGSARQSLRSTERFNGKNNENPVAGRNKSESVSLFFFAFVAENLPNLLVYVGQFSESFVDVIKYNFALSLDVYYCLIDFIIGSEFLNVRVIIIRLI